MTMISMMTTTEFPPYRRDTETRTAYYFKTEAAEDAVL